MCASLPLQQALVAPCSVCGGVDLLTPPADLFVPLRALGTMIFVSSFVGRFSFSGGSRASVSDSTDQ